MMTDGRRPRAVALDVDGTLVGYEGVAAVPSTLVVDAVQRVRDAGVHVVLATGRAVYMTERVLKHLGVTHGYAVCSNGAAIADVSTGRPVHTVTFDATDPVRYFVDMIPDALLAAENPSGGFRVTGDFPAGELDGEVIVVDHDELVAGPITRLVVRWPNGDRDRLSEIAQASGLASVDYAIGYHAWLDIMPAGVTKASGLAQVAEWLGFDAADTLAVGDGHNDVEMLAWAGHGVAMGQAPDDVKAVADAVCGHIDDDGLAALLASFFPYPE